jgi:hypothetical protein
MSDLVLPDCRTRDPKGRIPSRAGPWVPIFCANCGKPGGAVPEENVTFAFYLCNYCVETYGAIANTLMVPDEIWWEQVRQEQEAAKDQWAEIAAEQDAQRRHKEG